MAETFQFYLQKKSKTRRKSSGSAHCETLSVIDRDNYKKCINNIQHYKKWLCYVRIIVTILTVGSERNTTHTLP